MREVIEGFLKDHGPAAHPGLLHQHLTNERGGRTPTCREWQAALTTWNQLLKKELREGE